MGFGVASRYDISGDLPTSLTNVITTWAPSCEGGRYYHSSTAADSCAPVGAEKLWTALFSGMSVEEEQDKETAAASASLKPSIALITLAFACLYGS